jgi:hypothetical protein
MSMLQIIKSLTWGVTLAILEVVAVLAAESPTIQWNDKAQSQILNRSELDKSATNTSKFRPHQVRQITWPTDSEIASSSIAVGESLRESCLKWLRKFVAEQYLPTDVSKHLVAMDNWTPTGRDPNQKGLDVFIVRFSKDRYVIHIYETPAFAVVAVADERLVDKPRTDHRDWVLEVAALVLRSTLKPQADLNDVHVSESILEDRKVSRVSWLIGSVTVREGKRRFTNGIEAARVGASSIQAETDGRFIVFTILKETGGPTRPDPYVERF